MKFTNQLQEDVFEFFNKHEDFHFHGYTGTFFFKTWKKGEEKHQIDSKKPHGGKDSISATVCIFSNSQPEHEKHGVEVKIEMYLWGYQTEEIVFQGWVENIKQLEVICHAVGLSVKETTPIGSTSCSMCEKPSDKVNISNYPICDYCLGW